MAGIVFACVASHGWPTIPDLSEDALGALRTRAALQALGRSVVRGNEDDASLSVGRRVWTEAHAHGLHRVSRKRNTATSAGWLSIDDGRPGR